MSAVRVAIAGSSGSIGTQTLDVVRAEQGRYEVVALGVGSSIDVLIAQALEFRVVAVHVSSLLELDDGLFEEADLVRVLPLFVLEQGEIVEQLGVAALQLADVPHAPGSEDFDAKVLYVVLQLRNPFLLRADKVRVHVRVRFQVPHRLRLPPPHEHRKRQCGEEEPPHDDGQ